MPRFLNINDVLVQCTAEEEAEFDAKASANPPPTLRATIEKKITKMKAKIALRYSNNVDRYYLKKARLEAEGKSYEVPEKIKNYTTALKTVSDKMEIDINALSLIDDVRDYKISWPDNPKE